MRCALAAPRVVGADAPVLEARVGIDPDGDAGREVRVAAGLPHGRDPIRVAGAVVDVSAARHVRGALQRTAAVVKAGAAVRHGDPADSPGRAVDVAVLLRDAPQPTL